MNANGSLPSPLSRLDESLNDAEVVIVRSGLTDVRPLKAWIRLHPGVRVREVLMEMGSAAQRARFQELKACTAWGTLPQVFVHGDFVGGVDEFFDHPLVTGRGQGSRRASGKLPLRVLVLTLGFAGLVPFLAGLFMVYVELPLARDAAVWWLAAYGAVIATFLGAVHWGHALAGADPDADRTIVWAVVPSILAWLTLLLPLAWILPLQMGLFALILGVDARVGAWRTWPGYYRRLRIILTAVVVLIMGAASLILMTSV